jgi:hypothetical protein
MDNLQPSVPVSRPGSYAKWVCIVGLVLCCVPLLGIVAALIQNAKLPPGDTGEAMGLGLMYVLVLPWTFAPAVIVCGCGAAMSALAGRGHSGRDSRIWLALSVAGPVLVVICYGVALWVMW